MRLRTKGRRGEKKGFEKITTELHGGESKNRIITPCYSRLSVGQQYSVVDSFFSAYSFAGSTFGS